MLRKAFDFFLFSSLYIAGCAILMVHQSNHLLHLKYRHLDYFAFVFFSTMCSYNFHWYLTPSAETEKIRNRWTDEHRGLHFAMFIIGLLGSGWYFFNFIGHWFWMSGAVVLTFLYSAPKLTMPPFHQLRKVAIGKTFFLSFVWMYVTTFLPIIFSEKSWQLQDALFCISRFFLIYSICIIFDYRDRQNDKQEGIRSMITFLSEKGVKILFLICLILFAASTSALYFAAFKPVIILLLLLPGFITMALYNTARKNFSDYLYYFVLDGLMMFSALFTSFISIGYF